MTFSGVVQPEWEVGDRWYGFRFQWSFTCWSLI